MKNLSACLVAGIFTLFLSYPINASDFLDTEFDGGKSLMLEAIEHAKTAKSHKAHADHILEHAKESLEYVKKAEIAAIEQNNTEGRVHITESIQQLVETINHAKEGHTLIATEHLTGALQAMRQFVEQ
ncbi:Small metal-binding protein [Nitrosomonas sp. Nm51]|uniref:small metal-binding protein SmbP n=1 Tax=Nitrosomonas sp. Nm51 TaxID=133720 RepID=UPI0008ACEA52|nr:small metal-binding protein SmbP [Nitrosomonas sp. Nm51]SEQ91444.1 Small metal-binding protein [Nitrosomonas sp. Nm51]